MRESEMEQVAKLIDKLEPKMTDSEVDVLIRKLKWHLEKRAIARVERLRDQGRI